MKCPICEEGNLILPTRSVPDYLIPPVYECDECGDLVSLADYDEDLEGKGVKQ